MTQLLFKNNDSTTLNAPLTNIAVTATLAPGSGATLPAPGAGQAFFATFIDAATGLLNEIVRVTAVAGDVVTMVRAQDGTTAKAWATGDIFALLINAGTMGAMLQKDLVQDIMYGGVATGTANAISITTAAATTSLKAGQQFSFVAAFTTTAAAPTLAVNGFAAAPITFIGTGSIPAAALVAGAMYVVEYDGTNFRLVSPPTRFGSLSVNNAAGTDRIYAFQTTGLQRIQLMANSAAESGGNAGSDLALNMYDDTGAFLAVAWFVTRATGVQQFNFSPIVPNLSFGDNSGKAVNSAFVQAAVQPFASGTRMPFNQSSAPTGWTKDTSGSLNDSIMRIVTGSAGNGGTNAFSSFNSQTATAGHQLTLAESPSHAHSFVKAPSSNNTSGTSTTPANTGGSSQGTDSQGGDGSHAHGITTGILYNDFIIAQKN